MARALITGGTGVLGRHLIDHLLADGRSAGDLRVLCRRGDDALTSRGIDVVKGSVTELEDFVGAAEGCELVYHLAGLVDRSPDALGNLMKVHVEGARNAVRATATTGATRLLLASTSGTIGVSTDGEHVATEEDEVPLELIRDWPYYLSKHYAEQTALETAAAEGVDVVIVNPTLLLGPGDDRLSSTGDVLRFLRKQIPSIPSGGISFLDARDAAAATAAAAKDGRPGERYLLTAANWTLEKFLRRMESISGVAGPALKLGDRTSKVAGRLLQWGYEALGREAPVDRISIEMSQHFWYVDASKARSELGFSPRDPDETLSDTVADLRARYGLS
jgi:dihydroflavonol-4-reductase